MAASHSQRIFAFVLALLFLLSTLSIAGIYLWDYLGEDDTTDVSLVEPEQSQSQQQNETPQESQQVNELATLDNFNPPVEVSELRYEVIEEGSGAVVAEGATISFSYTGAFAKNGVIFDSSAEPITYPLTNLIQGWQQGIPGMKVGETRRLFIPAELGYGPETEGYEYTQRGDSVLGDLVFDLTVTATE